MRRGWTKLYKSAHIVLEVNTANNTRTILQVHTGWLKKSKLLSQYNSLLFWATLYTPVVLKFRGIRRPVSKVAVQ